MGTRRCPRAVKEYHMRVFCHRAGRKVQVGSSHHSVLGVQHHSLLLTELVEVGLKERPAHPKFLHALIFHDGSELFMVSNQNNLKACEKVSIWGKTATNVEQDTNVMQSMCRPLRG